MRDDVDVIREMYRAFNRGEYEASVEMLHDRVELHQAPELPDSGSYYGKEEFQRGLALWLSGWEPGFQFLIEDATDLGDRVLMVVLLRGRGRGSGVELEDRFFHVWEVRDGKGFRCWTYRNEVAARAAATHAR
jgi:ketosteroid isomerase-like protein